jgi:hypothetical protein
VHNAGMDEDGNPGTYTIRATHPKLELPKVEENCPTAKAADIRARQLYAAGYNVAVIYSRTHKVDHADRS